MESDKIFADCAGLIYANINDKEFAEWLYSNTCINGIGIYNGVLQGIHYENNILDALKSVYTPQEINDISNKIEKYLSDNSDKQTGRNFKIETLVELPLSKLEELIDNCNKKIRELETRLKYIRVLNEKHKYIDSLCIAINDLYINNLQDGNNSQNGNNSQSDDDLQDDY